MSFRQLGPAVVWSEQLQGRSVAPTVLRAHTFGAAGRGGGEAGAGGSAGDAYQAPLIDPRRLKFVLQIRPRVY